MANWKVLLGNNADTIPTIEDKSIKTVITSPPYFGLRNYGGGEDEIGLEETPEEYIENLCRVFDALHPKLTDDGTMWVNLGDTYASNVSEGIKKFGNAESFGRKSVDYKQPGRKISGDCKPKDMIGIPWMFAFAMRARGWYLRQEVIWCLSGGVKVYAKTPTTIGPMSIRDISRLDPSTVQLWNGTKWTQLLGMGKSLETDRDKMLEITLRSGESISCTDMHQWPTNNGLKRAKDLKVGDIIDTCLLPDSTLKCDNLPSYDIGWLVGLYLAEGSRSKGGKCLQFASHQKETDRFANLTRICEMYHASCKSHDTSENGCTHNVYGEAVIGIIDTYINGTDAYTKKLDKKVWERDNEFLRGILMGYLKGDGHYDKPNNRWRLGFCRNEDLASDLRCLAARLGYYISMKPSFTKNTDTGKTHPTFKGELRFTVSDHFNCKERSEIVSIGPSKARKFWDLSVADEPHLFSLASGVLTHNCKANPMPESVTDRCTKAHEQIFLFSKSPTYFFDVDAIKEEADTGKKKIAGGWDQDGSRRKRSVWTVPVACSETLDNEHFAVYPTALVEPCVLAGSAPGDLVCDPFNGSGTTGVVALENNRNYIGFELNKDFEKIYTKRLNDAKSFNKQDITNGDVSKLFSWE